MRIRWFSRMLVALAALLVIGCGRVEYIRYVPNIEFDPAAARGLPLDQVYVDPEIGRLQGAKLLVQVENPGKTIDREVSKINPKLEDAEKWVGLRSYLELDFLVSLKASKEFADVQRAMYALDSFKPDAVLKIAVTEWHEGNKWSRAILGVGLGHTRVQWEGTVTDARTGKVLFAFADARVHPGGPSALGLPLKVWHGADLIGEDLGWGGKALAWTLKKEIERAGGNAGRGEGKYVNESPVPRVPQR